MEVPHSRTSLGSLTQDSPQALPISSVPLSDISSIYATYVDDAPFNLFEKDGEPLLLKQSRRGNSPYVRRLDRSFDTFISSIPPTQFFNAPQKLEEWKSRVKSHQSNSFSCTTNLLYAVLTFDHDKVSRDDSWTQYKEVNHFISHLKRVLSSHLKKRVDVRRFSVPEPHPHPGKPEYEGYAHLNLVVHLSEKVQVFPYIKVSAYGEESVTYRLKSRVGSVPKADIQLLNHLKAGFRLGNVDIQAISSIRKGYVRYGGKPINNGVLDLKYLIKYLVKSVDTPARREYYPVSLTAYSMLWWNHSRTYSSLSMSFVEAVKQSAPPLDLINNNDGGLTKTSRFTIACVVSSKCSFHGSWRKPAGMTFPEWKDKLRPYLHNLIVEEDFRSSETRTNPVVVHNLQSVKSEPPVRHDFPGLHNTLISELHSHYAYLQSINQNDKYNLPCEYSDCSKCPNLHVCCDGKSSS
jgi:hypothetical protein